MGLWNVYFIAKLGLYLLGRIDFQLLWNLLLALALCLPLAKRWTRVLRQLVAIPVGVALLYEDARLPPFERLWSQLGNLAQFKPAYLLELAARFINPQLALWFVALLLAYVIVNRWIRVTTFSLLSIVAVPLVTMLSLQPQQGGAPVARTTLASPSASQPANAALLGPEETFKAFLRTEGTRQVDFPPAGERQGPGFDVILLHICSLSWDDLEAAKVPQAPFFNKFDLVFRRFNSAATYSGPAAIRLLRASCGQPSHQAMYAPVARQCYILQQLQQVGFTPQVLMNHDGHFDNFAKYIQDNVGVPGVAPIRMPGAAIHMRAFDDSPILDDFQMLSRWYAARGSEGPVALYYNTISLHDGNYLPNDSRSSLQSYPDRLKKLLADIDRFIAQIEQSGRRALVIFVPEHGAALQGDDEQVAGLRELPTYRITRVPVAVKFIGGAARAGGAPVYVDRPTSYLALAQLLADASRRNPFAAPVDLAEWAGQLPSTEHIAENEGAVMIHNPHGDFLRTGEGAWIQGSKH